LELRDLSNRPHHNEPHSASITLAWHLTPNSTHKLPPTKHKTKITLPSLSPNSNLTLSRY
jgi:hypothetical protein